MDQNFSISQGPVFGAGYMPYFYQAGKFLLYDLPQTGSKSPNFSEISRYDFTSDLVSKRNWPRSPTVEDIVSRGYFAIPESEPETAIILDKKHTSKLGLDDVISQIRSRYHIYKNNMYEIELGKCHAMNSSHSVVADRGGVCLNSKEAYGLTKNLRELYEQQRDERRSLWADVSKLKLLLPEQAQNYLSSYRKVSILENLEGEQP
ncbi:MAG: hypothetical protein A2Y10_15645 [Planctomycetes bacterium GWF2_41_51]|nr:MAG: hypothetical protein A2Y10_15645 [Planctomycetes bacterium GWF2_41_51]HBG27635.1 hypothetical protein [Phycisphaerales bacterium]